MLGHDSFSLQVCKVLVPLHLQLQFVSFGESVLFLLRPVLDPIRITRAFEVIPLKKVQGGLVSLRQGVNILLMGVSKPLDVFLKGILDILCSLFFSFYQFLQFLDFNGVCRGDISS